MAVAKKAAKKPTSEEGKPPDHIFRPSITLANGRVIFARDYGLRAFKIPVGADNDNYVPPKKRD